MAAVKNDVRDAECIRAVVEKCMKGGGEDTLSPEHKIHPEIFPRPGKGASSTWLVYVDREKLGHLMYLVKRFPAEMAECKWHNGKWHLSEEASSRVKAIHNAGFVYGDVINNHFVDDAPLPGQDEAAPDVWFAWQVQGNVARIAEFNSVYSEMLRLADVMNEEQEIGVCWFSVPELLRELLVANNYQFVALAEKCMQAFVRGFSHSGVEHCPLVRTDSEGQQGKLVDQLEWLNPPAQGADDHFKENLRPDSHKRIPWNRFYSAGFRETKDIKSGLWDKLKKECEKIDRSLYQLAATSSQNDAWGPNIVACPLKQLPSDASLSEQLELTVVDFGSFTSFDGKRLSCVKTSDGQFKPFVTTRLMKGVKENSVRPDAQRDLAHFLAYLLFDILAEDTGTPTRSNKKVRRETTGRLRECAEQLTLGKDDELGRSRCSGQLAAVIRAAIGVHDDNVLGELNDNLSKAEEAEVKRRFGHWVVDRILSFVSYPDAHSSESSRVLAAKLCIKILQDGLEGLAEIFERHASEEEEEVADSSVHADVWVHNRVITVRKPESVESRLSNIRRRLHDDTDETVIDDLERNISDWGRLKECSVFCPCVPVPLKYFCQIHLLLASEVAVLAASGLEVKIYLEDVTYEKRTRQKARRRAWPDTTKVLPEFRSCLEWIWESLMGISEDARERIKFVLQSDESASLMVHKGPEVQEFMRRLNIDTDLIEKVAKMAKYDPDGEGDSISLGKLEDMVLDCLKPAILYSNAYILVGRDRQPILEVCKKAMGGFFPGILLLADVDGLARKGVFELDDAQQAVYPFRTVPCSTPLVRVHEFVNWGKNHFPERMEISEVYRPEPIDDLDGYFQLFDENRLPAAQSLHDVLEDLVQEEWITAAYFVGGFVDSDRRDAAEIFSEYDFKVMMDAVERLDGDVDLLLITRNKDLDLRSELADRLSTFGRLVFHPDLYQRREANRVTLEIIVMPEGTSYFKQRNAGLLVGLAMLPDGTFLVKRLGLDWDCDLDMMDSAKMRFQHICGDQASYDSIRPVINRTRLDGWGGTFTQMGDYERVTDDGEVEFRMSLEGVGHGDELNFGTKKGRWDFYRTARFGAYDNLAWLWAWGGCVRPDTDIRRIIRFIVMNSVWVKSGSFIYDYRECCKEFKELFPEIVEEHKGVISAPIEPEYTEEQLKIWFDEAFHLCRDIANTLEDEVLFEGDDEDGCGPDENYVDQ